MRLFYIMIFLILTGCQSYRINNYFDEFEQFEWFRYENNKISENYSGIDFEINPQLWMQGETKIYSLQIKLTGIERLNIEEGLSLLISADGERLDLGSDASKSYREKVSKNKFYEEAWYEVDEEILYKLAFSDILKFKINGKEEFVKGEFSEFNKNTFKDFYKDYINESILDIPFLLEEKNRKRSISNIIKKPETSLSDFSKILFQNGWKTKIKEVDWLYNIEDVDFIQNLEIEFEIPIEINQYFYPKFKIFQIMYSDQNKIPYSTKNPIQIYPCAKCLNTFPLNDFDFLFPDLPTVKIKDLENWSVFRKNADIYIVTGEENRQQTDEIFGYIVEYFKSDTKTDIKILKDRIIKKYGEKKDLFEAGKLIQQFLKENELYLGRIDGLFGEKSRKSLQKFLKEKEFYQGEINGIKSKEFEEAFKNYQKFLKVKETGWINIETARRMKI